MVDRLAIVTPWYPSPTKPFGGAFVRTQAMAVRDRVGHVDVIHLDEWPLPAGGRAQRHIAGALDRLLRNPGSRPTATAREEGHVTRIPVPAMTRAYAENALAAEASLRAALPGGTIDADVVHAHVGLPAGLAAVRCARPDAVVIITEHATFLDKMLATTHGRELYGEALERCTTFVCVSSLLRSQLVEAFPHHSDKIVVVPNVIPFETIPVRPEPVRDLQRWLYVGAYRERKGVRHILEAFALCHDDDPDLRLTLVGGGVQAEELADRAEQLGVADHVDIGGPVPPDDVVGLYHDHDLLVHASRYETFGMTIIESLAAGTPVLVTRCGGPEETLADVEHIAGRLVDVGEGPTELVRGFRELRARVDDLDLDRAREVLGARYGAVAVGNQLLDLYTGAGS